MDRLRKLQGTSKTTYLPSIPFLGVSPRDTRSVGDRRNLGIFRGALLLLGWILLCPSCFSTRPPERMHFFIPAVEAAPGTEKLPYRIQVHSFRAAPHLKGDRIAARISETEVEYYRNYRWAGSLNELVTQEVRNFLNGSFEQVCESEAPADLALIGRINLFEERNSSSWSGAVSLSMTLLNLETGQQVWSKTLESEKMAESRNPQSSVEAMQICFHRILLQAQQEWFEVLKSP